MTTYPGQRNLDESRGVYRAGQMETVGSAQVAVPESVVRPHRCLTRTDHTHRLVMMCRHMLRGVIGQLVADRLAILDNLFVSEFRIKITLDKTCLLTTCSWGP